MFLPADQNLLLLLLCVFYRLYTHYTDYCSPGLEHWSCKPGVASSNLAGASNMFCAKFRANSTQRLRNINSIHGSYESKSLHQCNFTPNILFQTIFASYHCTVLFICKYIFPVAQG